MGMSCAIWQVAEETVDDLIADPSLGEEVLEELYAYDNELASGEKIFLDIDKAWAGINFLCAKGHLNLKDNFLLLGGSELSALDQGYGPARYFEPKEVTQLSQVLQHIKFEKLREGLQVSDLISEEVYPFRPNETDSEAFGYIEIHLNSLVQFVKKAAEGKRGLITYLF